MEPVLTIDRTISQGDKDRKSVRLIQEWINLHGERILIDGIFGPATAEAVRRFQTKAGLEVSGSMDPTTFEDLVEPMQYVLGRVNTDYFTISDLALAYAAKHAEVNAREVGGNNAGPWVRLYMDGHEGADWPWCAGFVSFCLGQAAGQMSTTSPVKKTYSCDTLANWAKQNGCLVRGNAGDLSRVKPGHIFLVRKSENDWSHTGLVSNMGEDHCDTIEGNTNDEGSAEGYEVCARIRAFEKLDFVAY